MFSLYCERMSFWTNFIDRKASNKGPESGQEGEAEDLSLLSGSSGSHDRRCRKEPDLVKPSKHPHCVSNSCHYLLIRCIPLNQGFSNVSILFPCFKRGTHQAMARLRTLNWVKWQTVIFLPGTPLKTPPGPHWQSVAYSRPSLETWWEWHEKLGSKQVWENDASATTNLLVFIRAAVPIYKATRYKMY